MKYYTPFLSYSSSPTVEVYNIQDKISKKQEISALISTWLDIHVIPCIYGDSILVSTLHTGVVQKPSTGGNDGENLTYLSRPNILRAYLVFKNWASV